MVFFVMRGDDVASCASKRLRGAGEKLCLVMAFAIERLPQFPPVSFSNEQAVMLLLRNTTITETRRVHLHCRVIPANNKQQ